MKFSRADGMTVPMRVTTLEDVERAGEMMAEAVWAKRPWFERVFMFWRRTWYRRACMAATSVWFSGSLLLDEAKLADPVFVQKLHEGDWEKYPWLEFWFEHYVDMKLVGHVMKVAKSLA